MVSQSLLNNTNVQVTSALGGMQVLEYVQDMSVSHLPRSYSTTCPA